MTADGMAAIQRDFLALGLHVPEILLPREGTDLSKWATIACDQYTSQRGYWDGMDRLVGDSPSTLRLILPEAYLGLGDVPERLAAIGEAARGYLEKGTFAPGERCAVYVEREVTGGAVRKGLLLALDLEGYDYAGAVGTRIRSTEETVLSRVPPRMAVRRSSPIELTHTLVLIDDPGMGVIEPLGEAKGGMGSLYSFDLPGGGGHIEGRKIMGESLRRLYEAFASSGVMEGGDAPRVVVGDGNHSLAAAKGHWDAVKAGLSREGRATHRARYALVELVNIHSPGVEFHPIHRLVVGMGIQDLDRFARSYDCPYGRITVRFAEPSEGLRGGEALRMLEDLRRAATGGGGVAAFPFVSGAEAGLIVCEGWDGTVGNGVVDRLAEAMLEGAPTGTASVDYIHGDSELLALCREPNRIGVLLGSPEKAGFMRYVGERGPYPKKSFSMGLAKDKRHYLECRRID